MTFTVAQGRAAAERVAAEQQAIAVDLINLEDHFGRGLLDSIALEGRTRQRRAELLDDVALLWTLYESYRRVSGRVQTIMARSRPTSAELGEVEALVNAATVALPGIDGAVAGRQVTLDELAAELHARYERNLQTVTAVERVWTELTPRIDCCDELSRRAEALVTDLGLAADQDPAVRQLPELTGKLSELRRTARTDPLTLCAGGALAGSAADELSARFEQILADLHALTELREDATQRLDRVATALGDVRALHRGIAEEHRLVRLKIQAATGQATLSPAPSADPLGARLTAAMTLRGRGEWRALATELAALEQDSSAALQHAKAELLDAGQPLRERDELRGRLVSYRAKAAALGRIEDLALEQLYQRARTLLWQAPCDLAVAAAAVTTYQDAVNEPPDHESPG